MAGLSQHAGRWLERTGLVLGLVGDAKFPGDPQQVRVGSPELMARGECRGNQVNIDPARTSTVELTIQN